MKQLLVILKLVLLANTLCTLNNVIPQLSTFPITLINSNLNATSLEYFINVENSSSKTFAIAMNQMYTMSSKQWNVSLGVMNQQQVQILFKNSLVNWGKISLIVWSSQRNDLLLGSVSINLGNNQLTFLVNISKITRSQSSIIIPFITGFISKANSSININIAPFNLTSSSFMVNITNQNYSIQVLSFCYTIFSPIFANFQAFGDTLTISTQKLSIYYDVSQQIPDTIYKIYGFAGFKTKQLDFSFTTLINEEYLLSFSSKSSQALQFVFQYIYLIPIGYTCKTCQNGSIIFNNSCNYQCPVNYSVIYEGDFKYCSKCQKQLGLVYDSQSAKCVCQNETMKNSDGYCISLTNNISYQSNARTSMNSTFNNSDHHNRSANTTQNNSSIKSTNSSGNHTINDSSKAETSKSQQKQIVNKTLYPISKQNQSSKSSNASLNTQPNCSKIQNTILNNGKCICRLGFVNLSNTCIPLVSIGKPYEGNQDQSPYQISSTTVAIQSFRSPCSQNQSFSPETGKCQCKPGFVSSSNTCVSLCTKFQSFNLTSNNCICNTGYTRVNLVCIPCSNDTKSNCYVIGPKQYCRAGYIIANNSCIACNSILIHRQIFQTCFICKDGYTYNGYSCICTGKIINSTCYGQTCGNKKIQQNQTCDDGNAINGDGCSSACIIDTDYFCNGIPSICSKTICGNSQITGGEQCDDGNKKDGDGCSSLCMNQANFTCLGTPSNCFNYTTGNLSLLSITSNTNNVFLVFQTPQTYVFPYIAFMQTFLQYEYLSKNFSLGMVYCQQQITKLNRFDCLIIFPSGVPNKNFFMLFHYNYQNTQGSLIVNIQPSTTTSRSKHLSN